MYLPLIVFNVLMCFRWNFLIFIRYYVTFFLFLEKLGNVKNVKVTRIKKTKKKRFVHVWLKFKSTAPPLWAGPTLDYTLIDLNLSLWPGTPTPLLVTF